MRKESEKCPCISINNALLIVIPKLVHPVSLSNWTGLEAFYFWGHHKKPKVHRAWSIYSVLKFQRTLSWISGAELVHKYVISPAITNYKFICYLLQSTTHISLLVLIVSLWTCFLWINHRIAGSNHCGVDGNHTEIHRLLLHSIRAFKINDILTVCISNVRCVCFFFFSLTYIKKVYNEEKNN